MFVPFPTMGESNPPRLAATLMLLRNGDTGPVVFLIQRHQRSGFLGGAHVFPGGKIDAADRELLARLSGSGTESENLARVAAIRETWEEASVLMATGLQHAEENESLGSLLERFPEATLLGEQLIHVSRWVTPEGEMRRFDTYFFLAALPPGQEAVATSHETIAGEWYRPTQAIEAMHRNDIFLAPPTLRQLELLAEADSVERALENARCGEPPVVQPIFYLEEGIPVILLPGDPAFEDNSEVVIPGPTRMELRQGRWVYPDIAAA